MHADRVRGRFALKFVLYFRGIRYGLSDHDMELTSERHSSFLRCDELRLSPELMLANKEIAARDS